MDLESPTHSNLTGTALTRSLVGAILLIAAVMKMRAGLTDYTRVPLLLIEIPLGLWLITGWKWPIARWTAILWMLILAVVSLLKVLAGNSSCGCFGQVIISPSRIFALDLAALFALILTPAGKIDGSSHRHLRLASAQGFLATIFAAIAIPAAHHLYVHRKADVSILDQSVPGQSWPLAPYVDAWPEISRGNWAVLLYDSHCRACMSTRDAYEDLARTWQGQKVPLRLCLINTIADTTNSPEDEDPTSVALRAKLNLPATPNIDITTPTLVLLTDGKVLEIDEGYDECVWDGRKFPARNSK